MNPARPFAIAAALLLGAAAGQAQAPDWTVGATYGSVNDIERRFRLDGFAPRDITAWVDYRLEKNALLRAMYVNITTSVDRSLATPETPPPAPLPRRPIGIQAFTLGASYLATEGFFTSGIFGGVGGYRISPSPGAGLASYQDARETAFGFHVGVDGDFRITRYVSAVVRLTFHEILSASNRSLLSASAGFAGHF